MPTKDIIYRRTSPKGFLSRLHRRMQNRINGTQSPKTGKDLRYLGKALLSREEFYAWALKDDTFAILYKGWQDSDFQRKFAPSVDRLDSSQGYLLTNMEWVTQQENSRRGGLRNGKEFKGVRS